MEIFRKYVAHHLISLFSSSSLLENLKSRRIIWAIGHFAFSLIKSSWRCSQWNFVMGQCSKYLYFAEQRRRVIFYGWGVSFELFYCGIKKGPQCRQNDKQYHREMNKWGNMTVLLLGLTYSFERYFTKMSSKLWSVWSFEYRDNHMMDIREENKGYVTR